MGTPLTPRQIKDILILHNRGFSHMDIAAISGRSLNTIKRVIRKAKQEADV